MTSSRLIYEPDVQALYVQLSDGEVAETLELAKNVCVDADAHGAPVGFEILHADSSLLARLPPCWATRTRGRACPAPTKSLSGR